MLVVVWGVRVLLIGVRVLVGTVEVVAPGEVLWVMVVAARLASSASIAMGRRKARVLPEPGGKLRGVGG